MSARPVDVVAWKGNGSYSSYHLEYADARGVTLCGLRTPETRVQRHRTDDGETCRRCLKTLDDVTAKRLEVV